jgi:hypothetical protein
LISFQEIFRRYRRQAGFSNMVASTSIGEFEVIRAACYKVTRDDGWKAMLVKRADTIPTDEARILSDFSRGRISRQKAMHGLDMDYSGLLDRLAEAKLPLPELSDDDARRRAEAMIAFLDQPVA